MKDRSWSSDDDIPAHANDVQDGRELHVVVLFLGFASGA
jgi:hypothetical protein